MAQFLNTLIKMFKIKEIISISLFTSLFLTFLPNNILNSLHLLDFKMKYQTLISLILIITLSYYLFNFIKFIIMILLHKIFPDHKKAIKYMKNYMSEDEMLLLIEKFYDENNNLFRTTGYIEIYDGRKAALESKKVIYLAAQVSDLNGFAYNLQPYARKFLNDNLRNENINIRNNKFNFYLE